MKSALKQQQEYVARNNEYLANLLIEDNKRVKKDYVKPLDIGFEIFKKYNHYAFRSPETFTRSLKTKDIGKIRLALATHLFGKYQTPRCLQVIWTDKLPPKESKELAWYFCVATGGSLHKEYTKDFFTKKQTHLFLTCPFHLTCDETIFYVLAKTYTDDIGIITRIYKSKLVTKNFRDSFWQEVVRFFVVNPMHISQMNDLLDYISMSKDRDQNYSLKGRTVHSLKIQTENWHRTLARAARMGNASWAGVDIPETIFPEESVMTPGGEKKFDWKFTQITTSKALAEEGSAMRHCVYSYQSGCISGRISIWSLTYKRPKENNWQRACTIELAASTSINQVRGIANRLATNSENNIINKWAKLHGLSYSRSNRYF